MGECIQLQIPKEERQDSLAGLRKWSLERDDSGPYRVYRDKDLNPYYSVTTVLSHTAPEAKKRVLKKWLDKPGSEEQLELACARGTLTHEHCEYVLKTANKIAINIGNSRNNWRTYDDGLARVPKAITTSSIKKAIQNAPKVPFGARKYAKNLAAWIEENVAAIHASEFSLKHSAGMAGTADALIDYGIKPGNLCIVDFKTSSARKDKPDEWLQDHLDQLGAYTSCLGESCNGLRPTMGVIVIARENGVQVREVSQLELLGASQRFNERLEIFKAMVELGAV